jgi:uncharacterized protein YbcI
MPAHESPRVVAERGAISAQISREIVQLHANLYGRGPTKAKTFVHEDHILCLLEDVFTPAERTLVNAGSEEQVWATRRAFQDAVREQFLEIVERVSGRPVRAFMSMVHMSPEVSAELFLLEPAPDGDGAGLDGASADGARADGASVDGARVDGASADGARADGASADGARVHGAAADTDGKPAPDGGPPIDG